MLTPLPVWPSPKAQLYASGAFSGSVEVEALNTQTRALQEETKRGVGGRLTGPLSSLGVIATENRMSRPTAGSVVAVRAAAVPVATAPFESPRTALILPPP